MKKVFIQAWDGPWGWRSVFYDWHKARKDKNKIVIGFELVDDILEADIVFQVDLTEWKRTVKLKDDVKVIANVLDFAEWNNNGKLDESTKEYVTAMVSRGANFTAISKKVQQQLLDEFEIKAQAFYYPSQVTVELINSARSINKRKKQIISFCRLGDPGKAIPEALDAWRESRAAGSGWRYILAGPESVNTSILPKGVTNMGFLPPEQLYLTIAQSAYVLMPSYGEGLGLPIIEGALVGAPFITRDIQPMKDVFKKVWSMSYTFKNNQNLASTIMTAVNEFQHGNYYDLLNRMFSIAWPWCRESAFELLENYIIAEVINDRTP